MIADLHLEGGGARGDLGADRSQAVDAEALAGQLRRDRRALDDVAAPLAGAREAVAADHAARAGDDEAKRELGDRRRVGVAGVRDDDAARARRRAVDALVAGAVAGDQAELRQRVDQRRVGLEAADGDERAGVARLRRNGVGLHTFQTVQRILAGPSAEQTREKSGGDEDGGLHGGPWRS